MKHLAGESNTKNTKLRKHTTICNKRQRNTETTYIQKVMQEEETGEDQNQAEANQGISEDRDRNKSYTQHE